ncbi:uncharacterized protein CTHT_0032430 [Thermochaetoides thermophila DSM 1495]|uniref:Uncharacterized protein n=1 Tax=Chaetomium thermophilum (strain DSM 1495 / CBS 144.50 / IMI 039719) TaxID=759272 RepID=G0S567_CHATD|nr:hypothetical protein CTHT_0032430 [Thermochaetoides thermophila DSM 1495]EGS21386.1 hypothetical protein CTHT_0032430 [Thermochaetoides thermophila DSM 1495]
MPTPHLHPRSRMTSSLFATTVLASFLVVALPHALPCPAPRRALADVGDPASTDPNACPKRRRRRKIDDGAVTGSEEGSDVVEFNGGDCEGKCATTATTRRRHRECPVPKPGGILGEWLGFNKPTTTTNPMNTETTKTSPQSQR